MTFGTIIIKTIVYGNRKSENIKLVAHYFDMFNIFYLAAPLNLLQIASVSRSVSKKGSFWVRLTGYKTDCIALWQPSEAEERVFKRLNHLHRSISAFMIFNLRHSGTSGHGLNFLL